MGPTSATTHRLGLSVRPRTLFAASVVNSLYVNLDDTNISRSSALKRAQEERLSISKQVKEDYVVPDKAVAQWDGKILKMRGNIQSNRVCVYISVPESCLGFLRQGVGLVLMKQRLSKPC